MRIAAGPFMRRRVYGGPMDGFGIRARARLNQVGNPVVVGIDPHLQHLPALLRTRFEGRLHTAAGRRAAAEAVASWALPVVEALGGRV